MPNAGYGSNRRTRHLMPSGFAKFVVNNVNDLDMLLMHNRTYCAEVAHNCSSRYRLIYLVRDACVNL